MPQRIESHQLVQQGASWQQACWRRLAQHWHLKSVATASYMAVFFYAYFAILHSPQFPVVVMGTTSIDAWIPFWPSSFYAYASLWVYTSLVPALQPNFSRLLVYGFGIGSVCLTGLAFFFFFPTAVPYASADWFNDPALVVLRQLDMTGNACPSLHVASAIFTAVCLNRQLVSMNCPTWLKTASWVWCACIVYSTLAIKQHVLWDVLAGVPLGAFYAVIYHKFERHVLAKKFLS
jgi:PAP2 superfamily